MTKYIFTKENTERELAPNYRDYALAVEGIKDLLTKEFGKEYAMFAAETAMEEAAEVLKEDLQEGDQVTLVGSVYDSVETFEIESNETKGRTRFEVKPRLINSVYYYPKFEVAYAEVPVYMNHMELTHTFVFCTSEANMQAYLDYVLERKREYNQNYVTVYTDTDSGVESKKERITTAVTRDDVLLEDGLKEEIFRSIDQFFDSDGSFFETYNIPYKRGILLYGHPGNGKTTLVKSIAGSINSPVVYWQITEDTSSYTIQEVFEQVARLVPMVLVVEDIDSMPGHVRSVFLNTLDGSTSKEGVFLIGTTNYPEKIDPALINRAGRFDRAYELKLPTPALRRQYLQVKRFDQFLTAEQQETVVKLTEEFSFAQLNELYASAAIQWHYDGEVDIVELCKKLQEDNRKEKKDEWNESNHDPVGFY